MACDHNGSILKLETGENLITQMSNYFEFLSAIAVTESALWTSPYLDAWGLGLMITHAVPITSKKTGKCVLAQCTDYIRSGVVDLLLNCLPELDKFSKKDKKRKSFPPH